jgi:hypothetical protein
MEKFAVADLFHSIFLRTLWLNLYQILKNVSVSSLRVKFLPQRRNLLPSCHPGRFWIGRVRPRFRCRSRTPPSKKMNVKNVEEA